MKKEMERRLIKDNNFERKKCNKIKCVKRKRQKNLRKK